MIIITKFDISDPVVLLVGNKVTTGKVKHITVTKDNNGNIRKVYTIIYQSSCVLENIDESSLFVTKEELLKSL